MFQEKQNQPLSTKVLKMPEARMNHSSAEAGQSTSPEKAGLPTVDDKSFDAQVLKSKQPVVVEVGAAWCEPCKELAPSFAQLNAKYAGKAKIVYVDADADGSSGIVSKMGITSLPTVKMFVDGKEVELPPRSSNSEGPVDYYKRAVPAAIDKALGIK